MDEYPFVRNRKFKNKNYLFLANARWNVKNLKDCIKVAYSNKKHLFVAGGNIFSGISVFREDKAHKYLNTGLFYSLSPFIHYLGMLEQAKKLPLFEKIDALLWPVRWHEPFGIAVIEALSQGIPVFGSSYGSLPELVPEYCGILCSTYKEFENVISCGDMNFNSDDIRDYCVKNFSSSVMADNYLKYYEMILSGEIINKTPPYSDNPENLLLSF
jgi:glycosyltransferase involved in cell wall biosynthesis